MESRPHHHRNEKDGLLSIRTMTDTTENGFAFKVVAPFSLDDLRVIPPKSHVLMFHIDPLTGRAIELDGTFWSEDRMQQAESDHPDLGPEDKFAGTLIYVKPVTDDESQAVAEQVVSALDLGDGVEPTLENVVAAFRSGWLGEDSLSAMLQAAAKLGRGVS